MPQPGLTVMVSKTRRPFSYNFEAFLNKISQIMRNYAIQDSFRNYRSSPIQKALDIVSRLQKSLKS